MRELRHSAATTRARFRLAVTAAALAPAAIAALAPGQRRRGFAVPRYGPIRQSLHQGCDHLCFVRQLQALLPETGRAHNAHGIRTKSENGPVSLFRAIAPDHAVQQLDVVMAVKFIVIGGFGPAVTKQWLEAIAS
jgi:hypothetical protein